MAVGFQGPSGFIQEDEQFAMSLLDDMMEKFHIMDKVTSDDGYGGVTTEWKEGATFQGVATFDSSMQARAAEKQGVTSMYTVTTPKSVVLQYHDVIKRDRDGKVLRITSDGDDKYTPASAGLNMRQVSAEEFVIPTN